jgi:hypothetical protein
MNAKKRLVVVIPSFISEGSITQTLDSILQSCANTSKFELTIYLSDSSPQISVHQDAKKWSDNNGVRLIVNYSSIRRIQKRALNTAFAELPYNEFDYIIVTVDDVIFLKDTVEILIDDFDSRPETVLAVGVPSPDPNYKKGRRASRWQMLLSEHLSTLLPVDFPLPDGSIWAASPEFIKSFRYNELSGSIHDDVELINYISENELNAVNAKHAKVLKIPAKGFTEFAKQTRRSHLVRKFEVKRKLPIKLELIAVFKSTFKDPLGFFQYCLFRTLLLVQFNSANKKPNSDWGRSESTLRSKV